MVLGTETSERKSLNNLKSVVGSAVMARKREIVIPVKRERIIIKLSICHLSLTNSDLFLDLLNLLLYSILKIITIMDSATRAKVSAPGVKRSARKKGTIAIDTSPMNLSLKTLSTPL